jgi:hypothetical protein
MLFGAIEDDQTVQPAIGKTRKSLEAVAGVMFGSNPQLAPTACGNAGNHAAVRPASMRRAMTPLTLQYCLQVFLGSESRKCKANPSRRWSTP